MTAYLLRFYPLILSSTYPQFYPQFYHGVIVIIHTITCNLLTYLLTYDAFLIISSATLCGTSAYFANSIE